MPRITPVGWQTLLKIFQMFGCQYKRKEGSHHHGGRGISGVDYLIAKENAKILEYAGHLKVRPKIF